MLEQHGIYIYSIIDLMPNNQSICFVRMDFIEQYCIKGETWDAMRSPIFSKTYVA